MAKQPSTETKSYSVMVIDLFNRHDPDERTIISGFPNEEMASEYARRRTWTSIEEFKAPGRCPSEVRSHWESLGEHCVVIGPDGFPIYDTRSELDRFLNNHIPEEARDWVGLTPGRTHISGVN